jgi:hypothetical protein
MGIGLRPQRRGHVAQGRNGQPRDNRCFVHLKLFFFVLLNPEQLAIWAHYDHGVPVGIDLCTMKGAQAEPLKKN